VSESVSRIVASSETFVTNEPDEKPGGEDHDAESTAEERPTVAPPFDPVEFAKGVLGGRPSPARGTSATMKTPPGGLAAPIDPGPREPSPAMGIPAARRTPLGVGRPMMPTLTDPAELEEARQASLGSRPPARKTPQGLLSLANARIPSNLPPRKMSSDSLGAVDREWEELATSPPPPQQQADIDASARRDDAPSTRNATALAAAVAALPAATRSVAPAAAPTPPAAPSAQEMNDRIALGDYSGALEIAEKLLEKDPDNEPVKTCAESCRGILKQMYITRIGPLERVPLVMVARDQMRWLSIDHRAGFVLSLVDGVSSLEMILDVSGMPILDALRILSELAQQRIISFR
jgi:hypothetical protein